ncbi:MAG: chemotaxis protein CheC [archaeon]
MIKSTITDEEKGILTEIASIGVGNASVALGKLTNAKIIITVPEVNVISANDAPGLFSEDIAAIGVCLKVVGMLNGSMIFLFEEEDAKRISFILNVIDINDPVMTEEIELNTIKEVANILTGAYLGAVTKFTGLDMLHSVPMVVRGTAAQVLGSVIKEASDSQIIIVKSKITIGDAVFRLVGFLLVSLNEEEIKRLIETIKTKYKYLI